MLPPSFPPNPDDSCLCAYSLFRRIYKSSSSVWVKKQRISPIQSNDESRDIGSKPSEGRACVCGDDNGSPLLEGSYLVKVSYLRNQSSYISWKHYVLEKIYSLGIVELDLSVWLGLGRSGFGTPVVSYAPRSIPLYFFSWPLGGPMSILRRPIFCQRVTPI